MQVLRSLPVELLRGKLIVDVLSVKVRQPHTHQSTRLILRQSTQSLRREEDAAHHKFRVSCAL